nr:polyketide synthase [synthetic construct]
MTERERPCGRAGDARPDDEGRVPDTSVSNEPIAIVGMACRFPRADGLSAFWRMLEAGESGVIEGVPGSGEGRIGALFPDAAQARACRFGAYLDELELFDAAFFRISPVEAQLLDPQQRMMLETCWRALEDAGMDPERLKGSRTGVYAGISNNEYRGLILETASPDEPAVSLYSVTGTSFNTAIGRVAFALGLEGPALALDTACSSSLVAIHQAVTGLQRGEADLALAGGVHAILSGRLLEMRANAGMLSPDGRCATFDAAANGYVRGEGCGIVVLKRLSEAEADGDRIWAVVRGSALNQDGASPGLTVPSGPAQEKVIEAALQRAGLQPAQVDYVEAHGTGTDVGDPIEAQATGTAYSRGRDADRPLLIGSCWRDTATGGASMGRAPSTGTPDRPCKSPSPRWPPSPSRRHSRMVSPRARRVSSLSQASRTLRCGSPPEAISRGSTRTPTRPCSPTWHGRPARAAAISVTARAWCSKTRTRCGRA